MGNFMRVFSIRNRQPQHLHIRGLPVRHVVPSCCAVERAGGAWKTIVMISWWFMILWISCSKAISASMFFIPLFGLQKTSSIKNPLRHEKGHSRGLPLCHWPGATLCSAARTEGEDRGRVFGHWFEAIGSSFVTVFSSLTWQIGLVFASSSVSCKLLVFVLIEHETQLLYATVLVAPSTKKFAQLLPSLKLA